MIEYPNGMPRPASVYDEKDSELKQELLKLWREIDFLQEQIEQLGLNISRLSAIAGDETECDD